MHQTRATPIKRNLGPRIDVTNRRIQLLAVEIPLLAVETQLLVLEIQLQVDVKVDDQILDVQSHNLLLNLPMQGHSQAEDQDHSQEGHNQLAQVAQAEILQSLHQTKTERIPGPLQEVGTTAHLLLEILLPLHQLQILLDKPILPVNLDLPQINLDKALHLLALALLDAHLDKGELQI